MKKFVLAVTVLCAVLLVGCGDEAPQNDVSVSAGINTEVSMSRVAHYYGNLTVYKCDQTGVYYVVNHLGGVAVLINADGTPYTGE